MGTLLHCGKYKSLFFSLLVTGFIVLFACSAQADDKEFKRLQQKLKASEQEKMQLRQGKEEADAQLADSAAKLKKSNSSLAAEKRKLADLQKEMDLLTAVKEDLDAKLHATTDKLTETEQLLAQTQQAKRNVEGELSARTQSLADCSIKNESLHRTGVDVLKHYQEKGCWTALLEKEPLTQLKRVELENQLDEYRELLDKQLVQTREEAHQKQLQLKAQAALAQQEQFIQDSQAKAAIEQAEKEKLTKQRKKEQSELDKIARDIKNYFSNFEW